MNADQIIQCILVAMLKLEKIVNIDLKDKLDRGGYIGTAQTLYDAIITEIQNRIDADASILQSANNYTDSRVSTVYKVKGSVANYASLPTSGQEVGDVWNLLDTGMNYVWTGVFWDALGTSVDITEKEDKDNKQNSLTLDGTGIKYPTVDAVNVALSGITVNDATTTTKGKLKLAGDLGGTADLPTVPNKLDKVSTITTNPQVYVKRADGNQEMLDYVSSAVLNDSGVVGGSVADALNTLKSTKLNLIDAKQFGAVADGTTNDTAILQSYLNSGQGIYIFPKGNYSVSGIDVSSYSQLYFEEGAVLVLRNNSDRPVLQNKNFSVNTDKNIEIYGLEIEGNEANQIKIGVTAPYTGEPTSGVRFFGVENLKIIGAKINKTRTYGIWISRVKNVIARDIEFNQSILVRDNQDGIHFNGLCYNLDISNIKGVTNDDMIALNANDTAQGANVSFGEIKNATIKDVVFDNNLNGIRLLSAGNLMDQVYINNLSGNVRDNVIAISSYNLGTANFGSIYIDGVNVRTNTPFNVMGEYGGYILVNDKIEYLKISNVYRETGADARPTIRIQGRANISKLIIDNITDKINQSLTTYYPEISFESGSIVAQSFISNIRLMNGVYPNGYCIGATGSAITRLHLDNIYAEQIGYGLYLNNTDISTLFVNNLSTNFIRYPFYLVNDSDVLNALITNNKWSYSLGTPNVYNILDTSSIVFAGSPTAQTLIKWDDSYNLANSSISETPTVTSIDRILRLPPDKQLALGLATATNGINITFDSTNKRTSLTTNSGNRIVDFVDSSRATLINGATDNATDKLIVNGTASGTTDATLPSQYVRLGQIPTSGSYTPTLTGVSNTTSISHSSKSAYTKVGNIVTFKVAFSIVPTVINTATSFDITLPIARANTGTDTIGSGSIPNTGANYSSCIAQSTTTTTVRVYFYALGTASSQGVINCEYDITQ